MIWKGSIDSSFGHSPDVRSKHTPDEVESAMQRKHFYLKPWLFGVICGTLFVLLEVCFSFYPPSAYAFCLTCHTRDLVNSLMNLLTGAHYQTAYLARRVLMVTSPALLIGAFIAARVTGEHSLRKSSHPLFFFAAGFFIMIVGIVIFGCPTRLLIRAGYGDLYGIIAVGGMCIGIWIATGILRSWARKGV
jgi:hypothetical protein